MNNNPNICKIYFYTGKCDKKRCKKKHMRYEQKMIFPNEIMLHILQYCDLNTTLSLSTTCQRYYNLMNPARELIKKHKDAIFAGQERCMEIVQNLHLSDKIKTRYDTYDRYGQPYDGEWRSDEAIECPYHPQGHIVSVRYILNHRDVHIMSFMCDGIHDRYTCL
jgi:hypothetical protein